MQDKNTAPTWAELIPSPGIAKRVCALLAVAIADGHEGSIEFALHNELRIVEETIVAACETGHEPEDTLAAYIEHGPERRTAADDRHIEITVCEHADDNLTDYEVWMDGVLAQYGTQTTQHAKRTVDAYVAQYRLTLKSTTTTAELMTGRYVWSNR